MTAGEEQQIRNEEYEDRETCSVIRLDRGCDVSKNKVCKAERRQASVPGRVDDGFWWGSWMG